MTEKAMADGRQQTGVGQQGFFQIDETTYLIL